MASDDNEHKMLFDIRGRRRNLVKVVYGTLAVLMGLSLFLVIGGFNIAELFDNGNTSGEAAEQYEEQAERIESRLKKDPQNPDLLVALTRAQINTGNSLVSREDNGQTVPTLGSVQQYQLAVDTWSKYLKATDEPAPGLAQLVAPTMFSLAETSPSLVEARRNVIAAAEAQELVAEQRPNVNSYSTLAYYTYFTGDFDAAEKAKKKAESFGRSKAERQSIGKQLEEIEKRARSFQKEVEKAEAQAKAGGAGGGGAAAPESLEPNALGGAFGGGLAE